MSVRQSERDHYNRRVSKTFRLHPDRVDDLDAIARDRNITQARVIEGLLQDAAASLHRPTTDERLEFIRKTKPAVESRAERIARMKREVQEQSKKA